MAELITNSGDALSRLIQLQAGRHDIRLTWTGDGVTDLVAMMNAHAVKARLAKHLWTSVRELMQLPELKELPEAMQAQIASIVLKAQVLSDLEAGEHVKRVASEKPKGVS